MTKPATTTTDDGLSIERALEDRTITPPGAIAPLAKAAHDANVAPLRALACRVLGSLAGRAFDATWEVAERAAFVLLEVAREADAPAERAMLLHAMGRGLRNVWLMPYVHSRLSDDDESVVIAAISAAGGLAFPALEEMIAKAFLGDDVAVNVRITAIAALGRMGADSAADRLVPFIANADGAHGGEECCAALAALTEIRSRAGRDAALALLSRSRPDFLAQDVLALAVRYLAEIGEVAVQPHLRALARDEDAELRLLASIATRAFEAERINDPDARILAALTERDRAVRALLARRLRTLPVADVLEQAEILLTDEPLGVIQIVAEVRQPDVTRLFLRIAADESIDAAVRKRAAGSIEADEEWERDALVTLSKESKEASVRASAAQTLGAFVPPAYVLDRLSHLADDPSPDVRGALLWALQLSARPSDLLGKDRARAEALLRRALADADAAVRKRAAYVAGNLDAADLVPNLVALAREAGGGEVGEGEDTPRTDLRIAAFVALGDIASPARFADLVHLWNREDDPAALGAASRALERSLLLGIGVGIPADGAAPVSAVPPPSLARVHDRLPKMLTSPEPRVRAAAARVAGLTPGAVSSDLLVKMIEDPSPRVREKAVIALGRLAGAAAEASLAEALDDADAAVQERAAEALIGIDTVSAHARVIDFAARTVDRATALRVTNMLTPLMLRASSSPDKHSALVPVLGNALKIVGHDDPIYESILTLKLFALEALQPRAATASSGVKNLDEAIEDVFPTWKRLRDVRGFAPLARSLRTAEMLYASTCSKNEDEAGSDADLSGAIVLWMKCLEGYMHAWLAPRLRALQDRSATLWELTDRLLGNAWPTYQRYVSERWTDPVKIGGVSVEVPLRSAVNALRDLQEKRKRPSDSPMSVTEWSRIMLFLALDHPSGPKNVLEVVCTRETDPNKKADRVVRLAHRLQVLAQVRNLATHRSTTDSDTLFEFRRSYYTAFEELTSMA